MVLLYNLTRFLSTKSTNIVHAVDWNTTQRSCLGRNAFLIVYRCTLLHSKSMRLFKAVMDQKDQWDEFIDTTVFAYNTSCHESTCYSPFEVMFGRKAVLPIQINVDSSFDFNNRYMKKKKKELIVHVYRVSHNESSLFHQDQYN